MLRKMTPMNLHVLVSLLACWAFVVPSDAFVVRPPSIAVQTGTTRYQPPAQTTSLQAIDPSAWIHSSGLTVALDTFDGSLVDPVVVSNAFWAGLQAKFVSLLIGQFLATIVFGLITMVAADQISQGVDYLKSQFVKEDAVQKTTETVQTIQDRLQGSSPDLVKLVVCIAIDVVGTSSEAVPIFGEVTDLVWAPVAATILRSLFNSDAVFVLEFAEEILPFTDMLPLATICWVLSTFFCESQSAKLLGLSGTNSNPSTTVRDRKDDAIDVTIRDP